LPDASDIGGGGLAPTAIAHHASNKIAMNAESNFFQDRDLRHAKKEYVDAILQAFLKCIS